MCAAAMPFAGIIPADPRAVLDGWLAGDVHYYPFIVQFEDTDAGGIVYHANYLSFAERGRSGWLRVLGISQQDSLLETGIGFVVRRASLEYQRPAKLGDEVVVETTLKEMGKARLVATQIVRSPPQTDVNSEKARLGHIFAKVEVEIVMVNQKGRPIRFPDEIITAMTTDSNTR